MDSVCNFDDEEECDYCDPCYIFCDSSGEDLCKPYKDRIFYNGATQFILPNITKVLHSCNKALNRLSHHAHTELPDCCCQRRIRDHSCTCFCHKRNNEVCQCRRKYEDSFRIVEVADASLSSSNLGLLEEEPSKDEEVMKVDKEPTEHTEDIETVENEEERLLENIDNSNCVCDNSQLSVSVVESHCEKDCPKDTKSTSESDKEICSPCERRLTCNEEPLHNEIDKDLSRNININVKVRLHKKKKKTSEATLEKKKCKCKRKLQGEIHKDTKNKCKCEMSKPIVICDKKPEPGTKFLHFFKCKNLDENIRENVERICACGKERIHKRSKSERERISSNDNNIFMPTTKSIDSKMLSTIIEESHKSKVHTDHHSENDHHIKSSKHRIKSVNGNNGKINISDSTIGDTDSKKLSKKAEDWNEGMVRTDPHLENHHSIKSSKDKIKTKNHNHKEKNESDKIVNEVEDASKVERKHSLGKERHEHGRKSRKFSRSMKHLEIPSHSNSRVSRSGTELIKKDERKNDPKIFSSQSKEYFSKLKNTGYSKKSLKVSSDKIPSEIEQSRIKAAGSSGDLLPMFFNKNAKKRMSFRFPLFNNEKGINYLFQGYSHGVSYFNWYYKRNEQCAYEQMKKKLIRLNPITQLPRIIIIDKVSTETAQVQDHNKNDEVPNDLRCPKSYFDYQQIYDLREIFRKFEIYKQQQFVMEYAKLKQSYDYEIGSLVQLQRRRRKFRPEEDNMKVLKVLAVHCILVIYFVIFVWFTFFD